MNYCKHLKKKNNKPFCKLLNKEITLSECSTINSTEHCKEYKPKNDKNSVYKNNYFGANSKMVSNNHQIKKCIENKENCEFQKKKTPKLSNKVHKRKKARITVSKETYNTVIERDTYSCRLIGNSPCDGWLELHHILYRSERKDLINDVDNCIMLCVKHHKLVHSNKKYWQPKLIEMNKLKR